MLKKMQMLVVPACVLLASAEASAGVVFSKTASKTDTFGGGNFGSGYSANASVSVDVTNGVTTLASEGKLGATATLFGSTKNLLHADANLKLVPNQIANGDASIYVLGSQIYNQGYATKALGGGWINLAPGKVSFPVSFMNASKWFMVGPVPVKLSVTVSGAVGIEYGPSVQANAIQMAVTPSAEVYGFASASVDTLLASAGVEANLTFLKAAIPSTGSLTLVNASPLQVSACLDADAQISSLGGNVDLWTKLKIGKKYVLNVFSAAGGSSTLPLYHGCGTSP